jgi:formylglycine-generating enzyme required for sulfatase activity/tRNA A-37 threonylcarbamoyl transferase component Bud32
MDDVETRDESAAGPIDTALRDALMRQVRAGMKAGPTPADAADAGAPTAELDPAIRIIGYEIHEAVSRGGQATVYRAVQLSTGRTVAVKVLFGGPFITPAHRERFEREADVLARLEHPSIVGILDRGRTADGSYFLVMDYVDGVDLQSYFDALASDPATSRDALRHAVHAFISICDSVDEAHRRGIVHRDLKPSNVRVDRHGCPHVLDFGLAHLLPGGELGAREQLTVTGNVLGSLPWASPEQACGNVRATGPASDVYALGLLMYRAFTGAMPYATGGMVHETIRNICGVEPVSPDLLAAQPLGPVEGNLSAVVIRCLRKDPEERYPTAGAVAADLRRWAEGTLTIHRPRVSRRKVVVAGVFTLAAVTGGISYWFTRPRRVPFAMINLERIRHDATGIELVLAPSGSFTMTSESNEPTPGKRKEVRRTVEIRRPFFMATTEVTRGQYRRIMGRLPEGSGDGDDDWPVDRVTWDEAMEFCRRLGSSKGMTYRLPTDAEWEYACRAGTSTPFAGIDDADEMGWHAGNSGGRVHPVGKKHANHWGLFDMHGNVEEWCLDAYREPSAASPVADPHLPMDGRSAAVRGGHAASLATDCRAARRIGVGPGSRATGRGFRVILAHPPDGPTTNPTK